MPTKFPAQTTLSAAERVNRISRSIRMADRYLRRHFPVLNHQDFLGFSIWLGSIAGMLGMTALYFYGLAPAWSVIIVNAILASFLHELEHDLIHSLYFKETWVEKMMMWGVWIFRLNTPSPFYRKKIHLLHHKDSGQPSDIEEQMIGNGMKWGPKRIITMLDQGLAFLINAHRVKKTAPKLSLSEMAKAAFPFTYMYQATSLLFINGNLYLLIMPLVQPSFTPAPWFGEVMTIVNFLAVVVGLPNFIRQGSLQIVSSSMHYFGDVNPDASVGLLEQCQVMTSRSWYMLPFQLFCFNFGSTHGIHHFIVNQPFYLRQFAAGYSHAAMKKYGVRFDDHGSFARANRFHPSASGDPKRVASPNALSQGEGSLT
ncbi:MAG: fatty acid desaturase [Leptospiraceae bacterium]|nr:fatty acid desaturase [Leptospiraceae bacterium]